MPKYILTKKSTIGYRDDNGEFHKFRKGDEIPEDIYKRLPERVQGFIEVEGEADAESFNFAPDETEKSDSLAVDEPGKTAKKSKKKSE